MTHLSPRIISVWLVLISLLVFGEWYGPTVIRIAAYRLNFAATSTFRRKSPSFGLTMVKNNNEVINDDNVFNIAAASHSDKSVAMSKWFVSKLGFVDKYAEVLTDKLAAISIDSLDRLKKKLQSEPDLLKSLSVDSDDERDILDGLNAHIPPVIHNAKVAALAAYMTLLGPFGDKDKFEQSGACEHMKSSNAAIRSPSSMDDYNALFEKLGNITELKSLLLMSSLLISTGADVNVQAHSDESSSSMLAGNHAHYEAVQLLFDVEADIHATNIDGKNACDLSFNFQCCFTSSEKLELQDSDLR